MIKDFTHTGEMLGIARDMNIGIRRTVHLRRMKRGWICSDGHSYDLYGYCSAKGHTWALDVDSIVARHKI